MTSEEALRALADAVERLSDPVAANEALLQLAVEVSQARGGFLARVEGDGLRWTCGFAPDGSEQELSQRHVQRVAAAVRETLDGVSVAPPPRMTGGAAPEGAVAVKAEAGHPPVYAFPLLGRGRAWEGVLGLIPDPTAPPGLTPTARRVLTVSTRLLLPYHFRAAGESAPSKSTSPGESGDFKFVYDEIISESEKVHAILRKLDRIIPARVPVLIYGETGTGKELIARAIHRNDPNRKHKRFYSQNCGAIPGSLLESELFGYVKGSFTGAETDKKGLFEIASGSTLFLDEIGEMSVDMQTRLLRVLQEGEVVPVGSAEPIQVDVRIVAATLRNLEEDIQRGRFREDLYYRLKVVRLTMPPLRERPEDIGILVDHFLKKAAREMGRTPKVLDRRDPRIVNCLTDYAWPGNIRELENVIRRLAYLAPEEVITYEALADADPQLVGADTVAGTRPVRPLDEVVEEVERAEIENALRVTDGNRTQAAKMLGINRRSLLRRLQKYGYSDEE